VVEDKSFGANKEGTKQLIKHKETEYLKSSDDEFRSQSKLI